MRFVRRSYVPTGLGVAAPPVPQPRGYSATARRTYGSGQPLAVLRAARAPQPVATPAPTAVDADKPRSRLSVA